MHFMTTFQFIIERHYSNIIQNCSTFYKLINFSIDELFNKKKKTKLNRTLQISRFILFFCSNQEFNLNISGKS